MTSIQDKIWQAAQGAALPAEELPALDVDEGQAVQLKVLQYWLNGGEALAGYKVGLTSGAARDAFGEGVRPFGYILKRRTFSSGDQVHLRDIGAMGLENELVFRVGKMLPRGEVTAEAARDSVDAVAPGFEINQTRLDGRLSSGIRVADNLSQWGIVSGDFVAPEQAYEQLEVTLRRNGEVLQTVAAAGHIDDHFESIARLANRLRAYKRHLRPGMLIITGAFTRIPVDTPGLYEGDFGEVGNVHLHVE